MKEAVECAVIGHAHTSGTLGSFSTSTSGYVGKSGNYYYTYVLQFDVPTFHGKPDTITFHLVLSSVFSSGHTLRAAIVNNLENIGLYIKSREPTGEVEDANQISSGQTPEFQNVNAYPKSYSFTLNGSRIRPGTYYLILWASTAVGINIESTISGYGNAAAILTVEKGILRFDTGNSILSGFVYVDTGAALRPAVTYLDTGAEWIVPC